MRSNIMHLTDMLRAIEKILSISDGLSVEQLSNDWIIESAIVRQFEIIGEPASHVELSFRKRFEEIPWRTLEDLRNILIHRYYEADHHIVFDTIKKDLPSLKEKIQEALNSK